jgi:subtilisin family serine protease
MRPQVAPSTPWEPHTARQAMHGRVEVVLRPDAAFEDIAAHHSVRLGAALAATRLDGGSLDRILHRFSSAFLVTRTYGSAAHIADPVRSHLDWDDLEHRTGLSRTFRIDVDPDADLLSIVESLRDLDVVEEASPVYLCQTPFGLEGGSGPFGLEGGSGPFGLEGGGKPFGLEGGGKPFGLEGGGKPSGLEGGSGPFGLENGRRRRPGGPGLHGPAGSLEDTWPFDMVGAREALELEPGDAAVIVAVVDSGVMLEHPEFDGVIRPGADMVHLLQELLSRGMRFFERPRGAGRSAIDDLGHGTGCASIIAARGLRVHRGLGGNTGVLPVRALARIHKPGSTDPTAIGAIPDINAAVKLATDLGAKVLNLSFGPPRSALRPSDPIPHQAVVRYALARGCIPVAASGNSGDWMAYYPAALPEVIAVGSVGADGRPSSFSCRGEHVALAAPGEQVPCAGIDGYQFNTGTSFAAPFVAAAAALLVGYAHRRAFPLGSGDVMDVLARSASPFPAGIDTRGCGRGIMNIPAALRTLEQVILEPHGDWPVPGGRAVSRRTGSRAASEHQAHTVGEETVSNPISGGCTWQQ